MLYALALPPPAGECCIALRSLIGSTAQQFEMFLTHRAEEMGSIRGRIRVCVPKDRRGTRERIYGNPSHSEAHLIGAVLFAECRSFQKVPLFEVAVFKLPY